MIDYTDESTLITQDMTFRLQAGIRAFFQAAVASNSPERVQPFTFLRNLLPARSLLSPGSRFLLFLIFRGRAVLLGPESDHPSDQVIRDGLAERKLN